MSWKTVLAIGVSFFSIAAASPEGTLYASAPVDRGAYYVRGKNVFHYGYNTGDGIAKVEARHADGSVTGSYRYFDPLGRQIVRSYIADDNGFRVLGNALPVAPETPAVGVLADETLYGATEGTGDPTKTNDFISTFLVNNRLGAAASERSSNFVSPNYRELSDEHQKIIKQQDNLIQQYERQLKELKAQRDRLQRQYATPQQYERRNEEPASSNPQESLSGVYFHHDRKRDYDFPAGFAYVNPKPATRAGSAKDLLVIDDGSSSSVAYRPLYRRRNSRDRW